MDFTELRNRMLEHRAALWHELNVSVQVSVSDYGDPDFFNKDPSVSWNMSLWHESVGHYAAAGKTPELALAEWERVKLPKLQEALAVKGVEDKELGLPDVSGAETGMLSAAEC